MRKSVGDSVKFAGENNFTHYFSSSKWSFFASQRMESQGLSCWPEVSRIATKKSAGGGGFLSHLWLERDKWRTRYVDDTISSTDYIFHCGRSLTQIACVARHAGTGTGTRLLGRTGPDWAGPGRTGPDSTQPRAQSRPTAHFNVLQGMEQKEASLAFRRCPSLVA